MNESIKAENSLEKIWKIPLLLIAFLLVSLFLIYYPSTVSFIKTWNSSETFTHGYLILPISLWLVWHNKSHFYHLRPKPNYYVIPVLLLGSFGWLIAYYVDVQVVQQLALVSLVPLLVFGIMGWEVVKKAAFPLFFLIFAVPMGEALVPSLIEFTADFTVAMVQMTGIPIYREGTFFQLPTGNWSVVEACSGVRYLIASVTLGVLYAYLTYQSLYRRVAFTVIAIIVPIIANGLRAFMIVMIGHFSDMELATGVDHLVYGWLFFGVVIAIMFYIGSFWREDEKEIKLSVGDLGEDKNAPLADTKKYLIISAFLLIAVSVFPIKAYTDRLIVGNENIDINIPATNSWQQTDQLISDWVPRYKNMDASFVQQFIQNQKPVDLFIGYYVAQRDEAQLITSSNVMTREKDTWRNIGKSMSKMKFIGGEVNIPVVRLNNGQQDLLVAYFYYLDNRVITNDYIAKFVEAKTRIFGGDRSSSIIAISTELDENRDAALKRIRAFVLEMNEAIFQSISDVSHRN